MTGSFRTIKMWQLVLPFVPSSCLISKLSWKRLGITGHYDEVDFFLFAQSHGNHVELTTSEEMMSFLRQREEVAERAWGRGGVLQTPISESLCF